MASVTKLALQPVKGGFMHAPYCHPVFGIAQVPILGIGLLDTRPMKKTSRQVLAENLMSLMDARPDLDSFKKITAAGGPTNGTLDRIRRQESGCSIDQLDLLANVYGLEVADLLVPEIVRVQQQREVGQIDDGQKTDLKPAQLVTTLLASYAKLGPAEQRDFLLGLIATGAAAPSEQGGKTRWIETDQEQSAARKIKTEGKDSPRRKPKVLGDGS